MTVAVTDGRPPTSPWSMYRAIVGIGVICALLIVTVFQSTAARIRDNRERALKRAIEQVLPAAHAVVAVTIDEAGRLRRSGTIEQSLPAFLGYDLDGDLVGAVVTANGMGYQDAIRVLYAYAFDRQAIVGFTVLESKETPGLGDRIEKDRRFLQNFVGLDARLDADGRALLHAIETVAQGSKASPWQIDGITGATISSVAVGRILNASAGHWVPVLERDGIALSATDANETP